jgi:hypothetical protein
VRTCDALCARLAAWFTAFAVAPSGVRWQKYNKIDRTTKLFVGYSAPIPKDLTFY